MSHANREGGDIWVPNSIVSILVGFLIGLKVFRKSFTASRRGIRLLSFESYKGPKEASVFLFETVA